MTKLVGLQAEINITADENIVNGIGQGLKKGSLTINELLKPIILEFLKESKETKNEQK